MQKLTLKQTAFIKHYMESGNATESYKVAGYKWKDDNVAGVRGFELVRNSKIINAIEELKKKAGLTPELLLSVHLKLLKSKNGHIRFNALRLAYEVEGRLRQKEKKEDDDRIINEELIFADVPKANEGNGKFKRFYN